MAARRPVKGRSDRRALIAIRAAARRAAKSRPPAAWALPVDDGIRRVGRTPTLDEYEAPSAERFL